MEARDFSYERTSRHICQPVAAGFGPANQSIIDLVSSLAVKRHNPLAHATILFFIAKTETQGFEPWDQIPGLQFSRLPQLTTLPNLPHAVSGIRTHMRLRLLLGQVCIPVPP